MSVSFAIGAATDVGRLREVNQDSFLATDGLAVVADGMGGHRGGEVASAIAVTTLRQSFGEATVDSLTAGVAEANGDIRARSVAEPDLHGMGTTLCALAIIEEKGVEKLAIVNVGDSRAYVLLDNRLHQITEDHSLVEALVREGRLTREEADTHPQRNIVTRALGAADSVEVDQFLIEPMGQARFLLCSDGLFNEIDDAEIADLLGSIADPSRAAQALVEAANNEGGRDNITAVVVDVHSDAAGEESSDIEATAEVPVVASTEQIAAEPRWASDIEAGDDDRGDSAKGDAGEGATGDGAASDDEAEEAGGASSGSERRRWWRSAT